MSTIKELKEILQAYPDEMQVEVGVQEYPGDTGEPDGFMCEEISKDTVSVQPRYFTESEEEPGEYSLATHGTLLLQTVKAWWYSGVESHIQSNLYKELGKLSSPEDLKMYVDFQTGKVEYESVPPHIWDLVK